MAQHTEVSEGGGVTRKRNCGFLSVRKKKMSEDWGLCLFNASVSLSGICGVCKVDPEINLHLFRARRMKRCQKRLDLSRTAEHPRTWVWWHSPAPNLVCAAEADMSVKNENLAKFSKLCWVLRVGAMSSTRSVSLLKRTSKIPSVDCTNGMWPSPGKASGSVWWGRHWISLCLDFPVPEMHKSLSSLLSFVPPFPKNNFTTWLGRAQHSWSPQTPW